MREVLDTRFLLEYHYSQDPDTRKNALKKMKELTQNSSGIIPTIVVLETIRFISQNEGKEKAGMVYLWLTSIGLKIENLTPSIAREAGILKSTFQNVPTSDCIIAATAIKNQAKIISDDNHFDVIKGIKRSWL